MALLLSPVSVSSSLTPTGCGSLAYQPQLTDTATIDSSDDGVVFAASITQKPTEAATAGVTLTLPPRLVPRVSALRGACTATDLTTCPPIGSVTVTTPLLGSPLRGNLVLVADSGSLPTIEAIFPSPFAISLHGAPALGAGGLSVTFNGFPDVPITHLAVAFSGGSGSLFVAAPDLCADPGELTGDFVAQSGATRHDTAPLAVVGSCGAPGSTGGAGGSGGGGDWRRWRWDHGAWQRPQFRSHSAVGTPLVQRPLGPIGEADAHGRRGPQRAGSQAREDLAAARHQPVPSQAD